MCKILKIYFLILSVLILSNCTSLERKTYSADQQVKTLSTDIEKIEYYVQMSFFDKAEKILNDQLPTVINENIRFKYFAVIIYDQMSKPEKAILYATEFLKNSKSNSENYIIRTLLLKNYYKVQNKIGLDRIKTEISKTTTSEIYPGNELLDHLRISLNFNCQMYCLQEVNYLQEIQLQIFYIIERDPEHSERAQDLLLSRYDYFADHLNNKQFDLLFRKKLSYLLYESLQKAKSLHLEDNTSASVSTAGLEGKLQQYQSKVEQWIYDHQ